MKIALARLTVLSLLILSLVILGVSNAATDGHAVAEKKIRIMVVSSYHREYIWSQNTNEGVVAALHEFNYLDSREQGEVFTRDDFVESSRAQVKKMWMNTKRKNSRRDISAALTRITREIDAFDPNIILLGDDNAANYIGNHYIDTDIPVVFWGINGTPLKYGLLDSKVRPGHNITGVYQGGHHFKAIEYFKKLVPGLKRIAVLSDDSPTGRAHAKRIKRYADEGTLPVELVEVVVTNSLSEWKSRTLALQPQVDGFFMSAHQTMKDDDGHHVDQLEVGAWYLNNIHKPEIVPAKYMVMEGMLCTVDESGYLQGYEAMRIAHEILTKGTDPATMAPFSPGHGPFIVNSRRAEALGLSGKLKELEGIIDETLDMSRALE